MVASCAPPPSQAGRAVRESTATFVPTTSAPTVGDASIGAAVASVGAPITSAEPSAPPLPAPEPPVLRRSPRDHRVAHVFVPLCDNEHQGIVPVPKALGDGRDLQHNLYWGAGYGLRTFFDRSGRWKRVVVDRSAKRPRCVLERIAYVARAVPVYVVADAYDGACMAEAMSDFLDAAAGRLAADVALEGAEVGSVEAGGRADVVAFVGHDGLMDLPPPSPLPIPAPDGDRPAGAMVIACFGQRFFSRPLAKAGCPLWVGTSGLLSAEAYSVEAALWSWARGEPPARMRVAAGEAYAKYQNIERPRGLGLFTTGYSANVP